MMTWGPALSSEALVLNEVAAQYNLVQVNLMLGFRTTTLKTLDTFGNCHRPVFSLGVYINNKPVNILAQLVVKVAR